MKYENIKVGKTYCVFIRGLNESIKCKVNERFSRNTIQITLLECHLGLVSHVHPRQLVPLVKKPKEPDSKLLERIAFLEALSEAWESRAEKCLKLAKHTGEQLKVKLGRTFWIHPDVCYDFEPHWLDGFIKVREVLK